MFRFKAQRVLAVLIYLSSVCYSIWFALIPIITYHGGWTVLSTMLGLFTLGFLSTVMFITAPRPQATPRPPLPPTSRQAQLLKLLNSRDYAHNSGNDGLASFYNNQINNLKDQP